MLKHRIIPILYFNDKMQVVQTIQFGRPYRPMGTLQQYIRNMENRNVDELILIDIEATEQKRKPKFDAIKEFASQLFCPVTYGGGISELEDVEKLIMYCGVDKVAILNAAKDGKFIQKVANKFGAQAIVVAVDVVKLDPIYVSTLGAMPLNQIIMSLGILGAGEILLTSIERNGEMMGYDIPLLKRVQQHSKIPIIINGGCADPSHMREAIENGADAVASSTMFLLTGYTPKDCARALDAAGVAVRVDG